MIKAVAFRRCRLSRRFVVAAAFSILAVVGGADQLLAQSQDVVRVEEDWQLVLASPASQKASPQFETVMSPFGHTDTAYARITWNYLELPEFSPGGLQLQAWNGDNVLFENHLALSPLSANDETITWTQVLETNDGALRFQISNGNAPSQPGFSSADLVIQGGAGLAHLNTYTTGVSVGKSGITLRRESCRRSSHSRSPTLQLRRRSPFQRHLRPRHSWAIGHLRHGAASIHTSSN